MHAKDRPGANSRPVFNRHSAVMDADYWTMSLPVIPASLCPGTVHQKS